MEAILTVPSVLLALAFLAARLPKISEPLLGQRRADIARFGLPPSVPPVAPTLAAHAVVIRAAHDADLAPLHDLAELDSAAPLNGRVLVAIVDGRPWAALGVDDGRVIADPFRPSAPAVELLRVRLAQLWRAEGRALRIGLARRRARRARA